MSLIALLCFLICLGIVVSTFRRGADAFSPGRVFAFIWSLAIGLAELKLSGLQHEWSLGNWVLLLLGPISFLSGTFIVYVLNLSSQLVPLERIRNEWYLQKIDHRSLYISVVVLFVLFVVGYGILVLFGREIPLFSSHPGQARKEFQMFGVGLLTNNEVMIAFLSVLYYLTNPRDKFKKFILIGVSFVSFVMYAITLQRLNLFTAVILCFVLIYYMTRRIRFSTLLFFLVVAVTTFSISNIRSGGLAFNFFLFVTSKMRISPYLAILTEPYMYTVMNLEMFVHSVNHLDQFTYGYYTFDFVTSLTGLKHWMQEYFNLNETPYLYSGYNTYTAFWTYYRDFGVLGVFLIGILGGGGISALYYSLRKNPTIMTLTSYCVAVYCTMLLLVNSQLGFLWIVYEITIILLAVNWVTRSNGQQSYRNA